MKHNLIAWLLLFFTQAISLSISGQIRPDHLIDLRTGSVLPPDKIEEGIIAKVNQAVETGNAPFIVQFHTLPYGKFNTLRSAGMETLRYLGGRAYVVNLSKAVSANQLKKLGVRTILELQPSLKILPSLLLKREAMQTVIASLFSFIQPKDAIAVLQEKGLTATQEDEYSPVLQLRLPAEKISELAAFPFIEFIEPLPPPSKELNDKSMAGTRANVLQSAEYGLTGEGVMFQINEIGGYGFPQGHIDFMGRSILGQTQNSSNYHSTHVTGIAAGAGLIDEAYKGYAPKARFLSSTASTTQVPANVLNYGVDLTNNSYGSGQGCSAPIPNTINAFIIDKQAIDFNHLLHVFPAGNDGMDQCTMYPLGYNTVDINNHTSKSVLTVGATDATGQLAAFSSKGPVRGGRLKPEIAAPGVNIWSTVPNNTYFTNNGTSMAAPAVMGGLGLLYQRYMQLQGKKPSNALMKALVCNTATDKGPPGPDYGYGYGFMNLNRALQCLNSGSYFSDSLSHAQTKIKTITIPSGVVQLKVMLYWMDKPASPLTNKMVINDLDLAIVDANGNRVLPYVLDTVPALVANPARRGADHINNIEQVVIDNPGPGAYTIEVNGYELGEGEGQDYAVVYDLVTDSVQLTLPSAGQCFAPGEQIAIQWDACTSTNSTYKLEISTDNGTSWQVINAAIQANAVSYNWTVPSITASSNAQIRLTRNSDNKVSLSGQFRILGTPALRFSASQCPGSIAIEWPAISGATDYEVMWYQNGEMKRAGVTTQNAFYFSNLSEDSLYWVSVRARYNGVVGRRAIAISRQPNNGDCAAPVNNGDLKLAAVLSPRVGRRFTSTGLANERMQVLIKNGDNAPWSGFNVSYSVNGGAWVTEQVNTTIAAGGVLAYRFTSAYDFSLPANYDLRVAVSSPDDLNKGNDTLSYVVRHLPNPPISTSAGVLDDLETSPAREYRTYTVGLLGLERFDYQSGAPDDQLQVGSHYSLNRTNGFELVNLGLVGSVRHALTGTYNLSGFDTAQHSLALDFDFFHTPSGSGAFDSLLVRGSETYPWILIGNLLTGSGNAVRAFGGLAICDSLRAHGQNYSSSFQLKWAPSQSSNVMLLDNIRLYASQSDAALISIDSLAPHSCGLSSNSPITVSIRNLAKQDISNTTVHYRINKGPVVTEFIPFLPAKSTVQYRFSQKADLSAVGIHSIEAWVANPQDSYAANNAQAITIRNQPHISSFPNLVDFEQSNGSWYSEGAATSWEWGTPTSERILGAASGSRAWKTNLDGTHHPNEISFLYTGCYDVSTLLKPMLSISAAINIDSCGSPAFCDLVVFQYTTNGKDWQTLAPRSPYNWPLQIVATRYHRWHVMTQRLPDTLKTVQFRFQFRSDGYNSFDGLGVDDFHLYDSTGAIYEGPSTTISEIISGSQQWTEFRRDGKLVAALQSRGQNLGPVTLQAYTNPMAVRNFHGQDYLNRNYAISSENSLNDSVALRLYFTDKEADSLLFARSCIDCLKPANAYRLGVSVYENAIVGEADSLISNNQKGRWKFVLNDRIKTVPFSNGYYVEFQVTNWGEFRLHRGGFDAASELPVRITVFDVRKNGAASELSWQTGAEINIHRFEVEVAKGNDAFGAGNFEKLGQVMSRGRSASAQNYFFSDEMTGKRGTYFYRLKAVDVYGNVSYSETVPLFFSDELQWKVFPNPSDGRFTLQYQGSAGSMLPLKIYNASGVLMKDELLPANGYIQNRDINLSGLPGGIYYLQANHGKKTFRLRLVKR